jgi:hypothetical protein
VLARKKVALLAGLTKSVWSVAFSPDGQHIVSVRCGREWSFDVFIRVALLIYANNLIYSLKKKLS